MTISFARHQFPPAIIRHAVWLYLRFTLSYRDVEDLLAERGLDVSYETVRRWVLKFGPTFARELRRRRPRPTSRDEMAVVIAGRQFWLWRAVDDEGEVLDLRDCQEFCVGGHNRVDGGRVWQSRRTHWTNFWKAGIRRPFSPRMGSLMN